MKLQTHSVTREELIWLNFDLPHALQCHEHLFTGAMGKTGFIGTLPARDYVRLSHLGPHSPVGLHGDR